MFGSAQEHEDSHGQKCLIPLEIEDNQKAKKLTIDQRDYWFELHV